MAARFCAGIPGPGLPCVLLLVASQVKGTISGVTVGPETRTTSDKTSDKRESLPGMCRRAGFVGGHRRSDGHQRRRESIR